MAFSSLFDDSYLSLREAITAANNTSGSDTITFDATVFTGGAASLIRLQTGQLTIREAVHIDGGSQAVVISGDANGDDTLVSGTFVTDIAATVSWPVPFFRKPVQRDGACHIAKDVSEQRRRR